MTTPPADVGQSVVAALESIGEPGVIQAQQVEERRLDVVDVHWAFGDVESQLVGRAVGHAGFQAASGEEEGVREGVVVSADVRASGRAALAERRAAKLAHPDDQRLLQEAAALEVGDQRGDGTVHRRASADQVVADVLTGIGAVEVPAPVEELHEPNALLDQAAGEQAVIGEARRAGLRPVLGKDACRLARDVHQLGHDRLHAEGQLILSDARGRLGVVELGN